MDQGALNTGLVDAENASTDSSTSARRKLILAMSFCFLFMIAEIVGGVLAGSLAVMTE